MKITQSTVIGPGPKIPLQQTLKQVLQCVDNPALGHLWWRLPTTSTDFKCASIWRIHDTAKDRRRALSSLFRSECPETTRLLCTDLLCTDHSHWSDTDGVNTGIGACLSSLGQHIIERPLRIVTKHLKAFGIVKASWEEWGCPLWIIQGCNIDYGPRIQLHDCEMDEEHASDLPQLTWCVTSRARCDAKKLWYEAIFAIKMSSWMYAVNSSLMH